MTGTAGIRSAAICLALASGVTVAAPASPEIAGMISRLGNESFSERERASTEILAHAKKHSAEVEKSLVEGFRRSPEPEIRFRCKSILMKFYAESVGYVGVYYQNREFVNKQGERQLVVGISQIAPGSPAAQAKLQPGDVILSVNGQPVDPLEPSLDFAKRIQMLGYGGDGCEGRSRPKASAPHRQGGRSAVQGQNPKGGAGTPKVSGGSVRHRSGEDFDGGGTSE
jgi:hypothetical protein